MDHLLTEWADRLGLQGVGIAPARNEVTKSYPWAGCVVTVAMSHLPPEPGRAASGASGLVARFARGADYHRVLRSKLLAMADALKSKSGVSRAEVCVDRSMLPERKLAVAGGIGWMGKNGCVYVEGCGSYASLGEIVVDISLETRARRLEDRCGDCRLCIDACPTGALVAPMTLDRKRCISYLTQRAGLIPVELRQAMGNRIYGCDVCQEVCPHNADVKPISPEFAEEVFPGAYPALAKLLDMDKAGFDAEVRGSSIGWIGRSRIRRNAAIAAGNLAVREAVPALRRMLDDPSPVICSHAEWALGRIG